MISKAATMAKVHRNRYYDWLRTDPQYRDDFEAAAERAADLLEDEVRRRAYYGVERPTGWYKGQAGGVVTEYSDTLAIFLLKGLKPDKYRERYDHRVDVNDNRSVEQLQAEMTALLERNPDLRKQLGDYVEARDRGVGPPNEGRVGAVVPPLLTGDSVSQKLPGSDYYDESL